MTVVVLQDTKCLATNAALPKGARVEDVTDYGEFFQGVFEFRVVRVPVQDAALVMS